MDNYSLTGLEQITTTNFYKMSAGSTTFSLLLTAFTIFCLWKIFEKAGKPGWSALIPVYNLWVLFEVVKMKGALSLLILVPIIGLLILVILEFIALFKLGRAFGKSDGFCVGLIFLQPIFLGILALDNESKFIG